ncbi:high-temperature-induced dauer-formation protein-domain-containing protein [Rhodocollybia butyracea]|uniref:High-temperature-induced dauer-formation protein-domain-containing protein n=1 Tax=Rhodocollybia butyracea TaxID=206335 RepID=A0A9P5U5N3_9AGAR|nr:high-temperature-induced dauer-formation protein-domain-containing protein [Rhodocollybia butyracea]
MFSKIPQRLTAPLGLLSDSEKLAFRSQPGGLQKLATVRNIPETDNYWNQYVILFDSASEVFSLITPNDIRRALLDAPENVATLIRVICSRLFNLISDHTFPAPSSASVSALATSFIKAGTGSTERSATKEVLNCLRVLQRVLPVAFEMDGETSSFEMDVFWKKVEEDDVEEETQRSEIPQFVIEDDEDSEEDEKPSEPEPSTIPKSKPKKLLPSLGERLFSSIIDLMFCCGFTLPMQIQKDHYKINYVIWEKGIGSTVDPGPSHQYDSNKTEVLRLLLVLLSRQIYTSASSLFTRPSIYTLHLVQKLPRRDVLTILCSLLNTAMNSPQAQPITINSMAGKLPYNHLVFKGEDPRVNLVAICFEVLVALLDFQGGTARDVLGGGNELIAAPTPRTNAFRYFLMKLHRTQDFQFVLSGILGIMEQQVMSMNNILPGARKSIPYIAEDIIFFWKMIELNKRFRAYVLDSDQGMDLIAYLLCYNLEIKDKPQQQHGICRALSYIVQTLSAEPAFGQRLLNPIKASLPAKLPASGTAADFLINALATTSGQLNSLYPALIIALSNCAPYFKNLSITSSTRLVQLFTSFSNPTFLLSDEGHPRLLFFMLEMFNTVIVHHLSENPNLIHGILAAHKTFEDLGTFTLARGLREIRRVQLAKEDQARRLSTDDKRKSRTVSRDEDHPPEEKKNLISNEAENEDDEVTPSAQAGLDRPATTVEPAVSPSADSLPSAQSTSQKAKGKMKERRSSSSMDAGSLERIAAAGIGRNGFIPTREWVASWQQGLPLDTVMLMMSELLPKVQEMQTSQKASSASTILDFLGSVTLTDVLPPAPPLSPRRFVWSDASIVWLTSLIWGEIFVRGMTPLGVWNSTNIRLFYVKHSHNQQRPITDTVSNVVGGLLGRTNSDTSISRRP